MKRTKGVSLWWACWLLGASAPVAAAVSDQQEIMINISGEVTATGSCTFDRNDTPTVDFGIVGFTQISESRAELDQKYKKALPGNITCKGDTGGAAMTLSGPFGVVNHEGRTVMLMSDEEATLGPEDLAIGFLVNGVPKSVDQPIEIDPMIPLKLEAELIQIGDGTHLVNGAIFKSTVILTVDFH